MSHGLVAGTDDYNRGFRRIVISLASLVIVPTALLLVIGIVMLVFYDLRANVLFGVLLVALVLCLTTGVVLALVFIRREANLSRLQLDFVSKVSHELRTPLTSIRMFVETLRYEHEQDKVDTCLNVLQAETERLSERIERLLDWGRMEAGRRIYHLDPHHVTAVVEEALRHFRAAAMATPRSVEVSLPDNLPTLALDQEAMVDALVNLLTNAHKYSDNAQPIHLRVTQDRQAVYIAVEDHGIGIPHREQRRVFEKFYRSDDRLSRSIEGSGLGLSIVQHVVHAHGGKIRLRSTVGSGSTFTVTLPLHPPGKPRDHSQGRPSNQQPASV